MKRKTFLSFIILSMALVFAMRLSGQVPQLINYQARLTDPATDLPVADGSYTVAFSIYNAATGGTALWTEIQSVQTTDGIYSVLLGSLSPIDASLFSGTERYLGVTVGSDPEMTPRKQMVSVPYAFHSKTADRVTGTISETDPTWKGAADTIATIGRTGNVGIGTTTPAALLHTNGTGTGGGNVLFTGSYKAPSGDPPASGAGTRMMWYPDKAALRAGLVSNANWDKDSIGNYSVAMGYNTKAKGNHSTAMGYSTTASGYNSTAMGYYSTASGNYGSTAMGEHTTASGFASTAMGYVTTASGSSSTAMGSSTTASGSPSTAMGMSTTASGSASTAMGYSTTASGYYSTAMGDHTTAPSACEMTIGRYNTEYTPASRTSWNTNDRLFVIGKGTGSSDRLNAVTVLKNGNTGLGTDAPTALLHTNGTGTGEGNVLFSGSYKSSSPGDPPASGAGTRMMWYPDKAAFRAGHVGNNNWNKDSIGDYSVAMGYCTKAKGPLSTAMGIYSTASGYYSTAMGDNTIASGSPSTAMGSNTTASGESSTAMGLFTTASGLVSTAMGRSARAIGDYSFAINLSSTTGPDVGANTFRISGASAIGGNLAWTNWSDRRLKKNIQALNTENNLVKIMQLNGVRFQWKENDARQNVGFIAQEVKDIIPESVHYDELNDIYSMEYSAIIPVLVEGIKEQQEVIDKQNSRIETQQSEIKSLQQKIDELYELMKNK